MYAKLINNKLEYAPRNLTTKEHKITNFNKNIVLLKQYGYKEVIDIRPEYDNTTHYISVESYTENEDNIVINYKVNEIVVDNTPTLEERVAELERINQELISLMKVDLTKEGE